MDSDAAFLLRCLILKEAPFFFGCFSSFAKFDSYAFSKSHIASSRIPYGVFLIQSYLSFQALSFNHKERNAFFLFSVWSFSTESKHLLYVHLAAPNQFSNICFCFGLGNNLIFLVMPAGGFSSFLFFSSSPKLRRILSGRQVSGIHHMLRQYWMCCTMRLKTVSMG